MRWVSTWRMVSSMTPTMINKLVPPKNCAVIIGTFNPWLRRLGKTAISVRKIAPANVSRVIVKSRKSAVGFPGRTPGMYPPYFFRSSAIWVGGKCAGDAVGNRAVLKAVADDGRGKKEQSPGEDDWHHTGVIHFQRHVLRLAPVHFTANNALGVLDSNFAHALRDCDHCSDDDDQEKHQQYKDHWIHLTGSGLRRGHKSLPRLRERSGQARNDAHGNNERYPVSNAALGNLIAQPHQ